jgi:hypothetical protein
MDKLNKFLMSVFCIVSIVVFDSVFSRHEGKLLICTVYIWSTVTFDPLFPPHEAVLRPLLFLLFMVVSCVSLIKKKK